MFGDRFSMYLRDRLSFAPAADKTIRIWNTRNDTGIASISGHAQGISDICWTQDSTWLASGSDDRTVRVWDVETVCTLYTVHIPAACDVFRTFGCSVRKSTL